MVSERDQVEEIKSKVDIVELIGARVTLKKAGRHFKGLCPFHSEKSPSFVVSAERQSYKCFGCQEGGDALTFLQKYEGMSFLEALEFLAARVGVVLKSYRPTAADAERKRVLEVLSLASEYYHYLLTKHPSGGVGITYLTKRGITKESIEQFYLGYAPTQWRSVSDFLIAKKGYKSEDLEAAGLIIRTEGGKYYDRFRGRIIFPLRDHKGVVVGFSGRVLVSETKEAKYINSPETGVYHKSQMLYGLYENREAIRKEDKVVLVEGELDVIPSVQAGVKPTVAIKGSAFTAEQAQIIRRYSRNILMSLDADMAGQEAIKRAVSIAETMDLSIRVVQIKGGKDPGDVARENPRSWREMVKGAVLYWDFLIASVAERVDPKSGEGVETITREVVPALAQIANKVVQAHYVQKLALALKVSEESVFTEIERVIKKRQFSGLQQVVAKLEKGASNRAEELSLYLLSITLQYYDEVKGQLVELELEWLAHPATRQIIQRITEWNHPTLQIATFAQSLPAELIPSIDNAYLRDLSMVSDIRREWQVRLRELEGIYIREKLKEITQQLTLLGSEDETKTRELSNDFGRLSRRLSELTK